MSETADDLQLRAATADDRASAGRLLAAYHAERREPVTPDDIARAIELVLAPRGTAWMVLAQRGGVAVGLLLANPVVSPAQGGAALRVESLYVAPQHRGRGIGRALLRYVIEESRTAGMSAVEVDALPEETAMQALCAACDFVARPRVRLSHAS